MESCVNLSGDSLKCRLLRKASAVCSCPLPKSYLHPNPTKTQTMAVSSPQKQSPLDWLSFPSPAVVEAPHPDLFEFELDNSLSTFDQAQVQLLTLNFNDSFAFLRSETPHGPPSTITVSSESAYETLSSHSESFYNFPNSPTYPQIDNPFPVDLSVDFAKFTVDSEDIANSGLNIPMDPYDCQAPAFDSTSYELSAAGGADGSLFPTGQHNYIPTPTTIAPSSISSARAVAPTASPLSSSDGSLMRTSESDPRKKYPCPSCTRSFARAYNLKTHLATHDPNRLKPYVCHHRTCGRSFSRKHDLGRHLVSIHRDETASQISSSHSDSGISRKGVGISVDKSTRSWCDSCGRGWIGRQRPCSCHHDVK